MDFCFLVPERLVLTQFGRLEENNSEQIVSEVAEVLNEQGAHLYLGNITADTTREKRMVSEISGTWYLIR